METLGYIHMAVSYDEAAETSTQLVPASRSRRLNWLQMSSAAALGTVIVLGSFTRVVAAFAAPVANPVQQQSRDS